MAKNIDIEELRKKFNKGTVEQQIEDSREFLRAMNPGLDCFSCFPPVDQMSKEEEDYIREGILEANKLRKEGKLNADV